jgi:ABC-type uncharacterized transport system ATPase subunit
MVNRNNGGDGAVIQLDNITNRLGDYYSVNNVSLTVNKGRHK